MFDKFLKVSADRYQSLETVLFDILTKRSIDSAAGAQLDGIGQIMGLARKDIPARVIQNLLTWTEEFDNPAWDKVLGCTVNPNTDLDIDNIQTADTIENLTPDGGGRVEQGISLSAADGTFCFSVWLKGTIGETINIIVADQLSENFETTIVLTDELVRYSTSGTFTSAAFGVVRTMIIRRAENTAASCVASQAALNMGTKPDIYRHNNNISSPIPIVDISDDSYRYALISQLLSLTKSGSVEDIILAYMRAMGSTSAIYDEIYPAMFQLSASPLIDTTDPLVASFIAQTMTKTKPAGVNMILSTSGGFTMARSSETDVDGNGPIGAGEGFGSSVGGETDGGGLARIIQ